MVQRHRYESPDELEVVEVVGVDVGGGVDLQGVVVLVGVLKKTIHRIENLQQHRVNQVSRAWLLPQDSPRGRQ